MTFIYNSIIITRIKKVIETLQVLIENAAPHLRVNAKLAIKSSDLEIIMLKTIFKEVIIISNYSSKIIVFVTLIIIVGRMISEENL